MKNPKISVIMNCYNSSKFLAETIQSVLAQVFEDWEVVFWDNQSTDNSAEIFKSFPDLRLKYYYAPTHTTLGEARNLAVEKATGEWIAFLDCDDIWLPNKLELQFSCLENSKYHNVQLVYSRAGLLHETEDKNIEYARNYIGRGLPSGRILEQYLTEDNFIPIVSAVIERQAYWSVGGIPATMKQAEDFYLFAAIAAVSSVEVVNEVTCYYRVHSGNLTALQKKLIYTESLEVVEKFRVRIQNRSKLADRLLKKRVRFLKVGSVLFGYNGILVSRILRAVFNCGLTSVVEFVLEHFRFKYFNLLFRRA